FSSSVPSSYSRFLASLLFLCTRPPPSSTLFPTRRSSDLETGRGVAERILRHDADGGCDHRPRRSAGRLHGEHQLAPRSGGDVERDRKSTRLNSSHQIISYAVFCLKKKKQTKRYE